MISKLKQWLPTPIITVLKPWWVWLLTLRNKLFNTVPITKSERNPYIEMQPLINNDSPVIIDGGANRGNMTDQFLNLFKSPIIHAFEPNPQLVNFLKDKYQSSDHMTIHAQALGAENAQITFRINQSDGTSSIYEETEESHQFYGDVMVLKDEITVPLVRLDAVLDQEIDLIKLDLQGYELEALKGCGDLLQKTKIVLTEVEFVPIYKGQPLFADIDIFMRNADFRLFNLYYLSSVQGGQLAFADAVYLNTRYFASNETVNL